MYRIFSFIFVLLISCNLFAQNQDQENLLRSKTRPQIAKLLKNPNLLEGFSVDGSTSSVDKSFFKELPSVIVALEKAFPGATYGFLGRDMDMLADAMEAFYLSIGQSNRVRRIRLSTPSMHGIKPLNISKFLNLEGLDLSKKPTTQPTFVMVDYTSFRGTAQNPSSQSRIIFHSVVKYMLSLGIPKEEILARFNITTLGSPRIRTFNALKLDSPGIKRELSLQLRYFKKNSDLNKLHKIAARNVSYGPEWHGRYGPIKKDEKGRYLTKPMADGITLQDKRGTLLSMITVVNTVLDPRMKKSILSLATKHGVKFQSNEKSPLVCSPLFSR